MSIESKQEVSSTIRVAATLVFILCLMILMAFKLVNLLPAGLGYMGFSVTREILFLLNRVGNIELFGVNLIYILTIDRELSAEYYPRFGPLLVLVRDIAKIIFFVLVLCSPFYFWKRKISRNNFWVYSLLSLVKQSSVIGVSVALWVFSLVAYFSLSKLSSQPVIFQLLFTKIFLSSWVGYLLVKLLVHKSFLVHRIRTFLNEPSSAYNLAAIRILFFGYIAFMQFNYSHHFGKNIGLLDKQPLPLIGWLIDIIPISPDLYTSIAYLGCVLSILAMLGFKTRLVMALNAITIFYVIATPNFFGKLWHSQIFIWISWILAFSPCYDVLSVDSKLKQRKSRNKSYGFHLRVIWLHFGLIYGFAGFYKLWLCGFDWALSESMINQVRLEWFEHYDTIPSVRIDKWPFLLMIAGLGVILFELSFVLMVLNRKLRYLAAVSGLLMHNAIGYFMYIAFFWPLQVFYMVFVPWDKAIAFFTKKSEILKCETTALVDFASPKVFFPLGILTINFIFGVFNVNSYPFSIYPVYAELVKEDVKYFDFRPVVHGNQNFSLWNAAKEANFRWENYTRLEYRVIRDFEDDQTLDTAAVKSAWRRWEEGVPQVKNASKVDVFLVHRYLEPERADPPISQQLLFSFSPD